MSSEHNLHKEEEIDLIELVKKLWQGRRTVLKFTLVFFIIGIVIAIFSPKEFTASSIVVPLTSGENKIGGSLGGLASIACINLGGGITGDITPTLYPKIAKSIPFQKELIKTPLTFQGIDKPITYQEYYTNYAKTNILATLKRYTIGLPSVILGNLKNKENLVPTQIADSTGIYKVSTEENQLFQNLNNQLSLSVNEKEGIVELSFSMPEPLPAAEMTAKAQNLLQEAITTFKIKKAEQQLDFIQERYEEAKKDFEKKQFALAKFQDQNRNLNSSLSQTHMERLRSDYNLSYSIFSELAKQLETQKIKVKEETPEFTVIEPISVPLEKSKPKRGIIIIIWIFLGLVLGTTIVFTRDFIKNINSKNSKKDIL